MTTDLAALALHVPYTASDNVIISDDSGLSIVNIGSFSFTSLPTPYSFLTSYMCLPCLRILFQSQLCVSIILLMFYSSTLSFMSRIVKKGHPSLRATYRRCLLLAEVSPPPPPPPPPPLPLQSSALSSTRSSLVAIFIFGPSL